MRKELGLAAILLIGAAAPSSPAPPSPAQTDNPAAAVAALPDGAHLGTWTNPQRSVHIEAARCGARVCGTIVWANEKAKADATRGGSAGLIGLQLFEEFTAVGPRDWKGKVFVPDLGKRVRGKATLIDRNTVKVAGCIAGGLVCKEQLWSRVG